jgi:hypothetical protein
MASQSRAQALHRLVASDRIEGTLVCRLDGTRLGTIERLMINKVSGQVAYAVLKVGDMADVTDRRFPLPWGELHYDRRRAAYLVELTDKELRQGPAQEGGFDWGERSEAGHIRPYRPPTFWGSSY